MRNTTRSKKTFSACESPIDELADHDKIAWGKLLAQAADGGERHDLGHPAALQRIDIGAKIDFGGRQHVTTPVARHKYDLVLPECPEAEFVRRPAEGAFDLPPFDIREPVDVVEPAAPDDADYRRGHPRFSEPAPKSCASSRRRLPRRRSRKELP